VLAVAGQVLSQAGGPAESRVRADSGRWIVLHGSGLDSRDGRRQVSVVIEAAQPIHLTSLLMRAYDLTSRDREITRLVLRGGSTETIARELVIASVTVQAHLRNIFEKTGVRSRRELIASHSTVTTGRAFAATSIGRWSAVRLGTVRCLGSGAPTLDRSRADLVRDVPPPA
jgi:DNA-binding CsgD family transcriptional regulator